MTRTISEQHFNHLQRMAERGAFLYSTLDSRKGWTPSAEIREFVEYVLSNVDEVYPEIPLYPTPSIYEVEV